MKIIGIDYGTKRVGVAISDYGARIAMPVKVIQNSKHVVKSLLEISKNDGVTTIIIGESKDFKGHDNAIMEDVRWLKSALEKEGIKVELEPEFLTSHQAVQIQGKNDMLDASAAALILQSYLDRKNSLQ